MSCPACKANMPGLQELKAEFEPKGLRFLAIHMPRGPFDLDEDKVREAVADLGITEPCALDNEHILGDRFETGGVWPIYFLFDAEHKLRRRAAGGFGLKMVTEAVKRLFDDAHE